MKSNYLELLDLSTLTSAILEVLKRKNQIVRFPGISFRAINATPTPDTGVVNPVSAAPTPQMPRGRALPET